MKNQMIIIALALLLGFLVGIFMGAFLHHIFTEYIHIFEDGSWGIGNFPYSVWGCFPWGTCQ